MCGFLMIVLDVIGLIAASFFVIPRTILKVFDRLFHGFIPGGKGGG